MTQAGPLLRRLRRLFSEWHGPQASQPNARIRLLYERFREILSINDDILQLIAEVEEKASGRVPFAPELVAERIRRTILDAFVMVKNLNQITANRFRALYDAVGRLDTEIERLLPTRPEPPVGPLVIPIAKLRSSASALAGVKMASLGEARAALGLNVPDGFVVTTTAFNRLLAAHDLWDRVSRLAGILEMYGQQALETACRDVQATILAASVPPEIADAITTAYDELGSDDDLLVAVRSSAVGEDGSSSHAGQYFTELNVGRTLLLDSYANVVASAFRPSAVSYRYERGLPDWEAAMAVGCLRMVQPRASGVVYSRALPELGADQVAISAVAGMGDSVTADLTSAEEITVAAGDAGSVRSTLLTAGEIDELVRVARRLEEHFGRPQDVEWAIDGQGELHVLQTRAMVAPPAPPAVRLDLPADRQPLVAGGHTACPGVAVGRVHLVRGDGDLSSFPAGGVLLARSPSPRYTPVMARCAAIVTEIGSPAGHMASLCREFGIPTLVGLEGATRHLQPGTEVTVDATGRRVLAGACPLGPAAARPAAPLEGSAAVTRLREVAALIAPLRLTDPRARDFRPADCRTLHDVTRFVHEKLYEAMFGFGDTARRALPDASRLSCDLPIEIHVFDVGGGLAPGAGQDGPIRCEEITSVPMRSFLEGLMDPRVRSSQPRPVSVRGFLSVLGESISGPPPEALGVGGASFAVISEPYMNFSTKAGYHFSTVDTYCGQTQSRNYVHLRFAGGGAAEERRIRRVRFLSWVLSRMEFEVQVQGDVLTARLAKYGREAVRQTLARLGQLTMCVRQLDMLMDSDARAETFAQAFLDDDLERFI